MAWRIGCDVPGAAQLTEPVRIRQVVSRIDEVTDVRSDVNWARTDGGAPVPTATSKGVVDGESKAKASTKKRAPGNRKKWAASEPPSPRTLGCMVARVDVCDAPTGLSASPFIYEAFEAGH